MDFYEICLRLDSDFEGVLLFFMFEKRFNFFEYNNILVDEYLPNIGGQ